MTAAPKKKLNRADFMFSQKTGETLTKKPGDVFGKDFAIRFLEDCTVQLFDHTAQVSPLNHAADFFCAQLSVSFTSLLSR